MLNIEKTISVEVTNVVFSDLSEIFSVDGENYTAFKIYAGQEEITENLDTLNYYLGVEVVGALFNGDINFILVEKG